MYDVLTDTFAYNLEKYGIDVLVNTRTIKALFKMVTDDSGKDQYLTMFTAYSDNVQQGDEIILQSKRYLALKDNSNENTVYNKTRCIDCNQLIKYELCHEDDDTAADLTYFYIHGDNLTSSVNIAGGITTLQSTCHFTFPLNDLTKRINPNGRFFAGQSKTGVWKIRDINYQNNFCELYCIRDSIKDTDDTENMIANRWVYEHKPDTFQVQLTPDKFAIIEEEIQQLTVEVRKNNEVVSPTPQITFSASDPSIVSIDPATNIVTGLKEGSTRITGSYKEQQNDDCAVGISTATIMAKPVTAEIAIMPPYEGSNQYYAVKQGYGAQTFTATISGVANPRWNIVLDPQGVSSTKYTSSIDNQTGTFTVECKNYNSTYLKYTVSESTTGKSLQYYVKLAAMF